MKLVWSSIFGLVFMACTPDAITVLDEHGRAYSAIDEHNLASLSDTLVIRVSNYSFQRGDGDVKVYGVYQGIIPPPFFHIDTVKNWSSSTVYYKAKVIKP